MFREVIGLVPPECYRRAWAFTMEYIVLLDYPSCILTTYSVSVTKSFLKPCLYAIYTVGV